MLFNVCALYIKIMNNENQTIHKSNDNLTIYGWNEKLNQLKQESIYSTLAHGRVSIVHRTCYEVISGNGLFQCELTGNMMYGKSDDELPCTGDWVIFQPFDEHKGIIVDSLPRERTLYRKKSGTVADKQVIASYVDKAFIVQSLDDNFNVRRVERFMVQIMEENISSVLVLNKADLDFDRQSVEEQIKHISSQIPVFFTSIHQLETIVRLRKSISEGETVVFVGSSGVGKSSLVNALCEKPVLLTSDISLSTGKGRHTSTRREMVFSYPYPGSAMKSSTYVTASGKSLTYTDSGSSLSIMVDGKVANVISDYNFFPFAFDDGCFQLIDTVL